MKCRITIAKLLAILAVLGLILGPLARPAMAMPAAGDRVVMEDYGAMAMPPGMPCCPDETPIPDCAKGCPLMALCLGKNLQMPVAFVGPAVAFTPAGLIVPGNDADRASLSQAPPPRPPKTLT